MELENFFATLIADDVILTVNQRLAGYLAKAYGTYQAEKGLMAWPSLKIFPFATWVEMTWESESEDTRIVMTDLQEHYLWEEVVRESAAGEGLLNLAAMAQLAQEAWQLLHQWQLQLKDLTDATSLDVHAFNHWVLAFQHKCGQKQVLSRHLLTTLVIEKLSSSSSRLLPRRMFWVGFDDLSPSLQCLRQTLSQTTCVESIHLTRKLCAGPWHTPQPTKQIELQEMVRWAYATLINHPSFKIGCVLPNLSSRRPDLIRVFNEVFYAEKMHQHFKAPPFNISAPDTLMHFPLIQVALKILLLNENETKSVDLQSLLHTPFIGGAERERDARAKFDLVLRANGESKILLRHWAKDDALKISCPLLYAMLQQFSQFSVCHDEKRPIDVWAILFTNQLAAMGWPGERSLSSVEFQLVKRWEALVTEYCGLTYFFPPITWQQAWSVLKKLISHTFFQPESEDMPIQVLGVLEASGIAFDALWVAGLDNETWPAPCSPHPFLPILLQKKYNMPHATSERELKFSLNITRNLLHNAGQTIFSYGQSDADQVLQPSTLIAHYPVFDTKPDAYCSIAQQIYQTKHLEHFVDQLGPTLRDKNAVGGSSIFKSQAACPFQAFAQFRLHAKPLKEPRLGLAQHERGSLLHEILAKLWTHLKTQDSLHALSTEKLELLISTLIEDALLTLQRKKTFTLKKKLITIEKNRLQKLIVKWMQIEQSRPPFVVINCEKKQIMDIGSLTIQVQIDRVDCLQDGSHIIIDYKNGKPSMLDWLSERPKEPQLPLYAHTKNEELSAILFAQIRMDEMCFKGLATYDGIVPGNITTDLKKIGFENLTLLRQYWQQVIRQLADDFYQGKANVDPKDATSCQYCQLQPVCRIRKV